jgi:hypothetical protein
MKVFDNEFSNLSFLEPADINNPVALPDYSQDDLLQLEDALLPGTDVASSLKNNGSVYLVPLGEEFENDDASWIMACTFLIYTMQTGIGLIESGFCSMKNEVLKVLSAVIMVLAVTCDIFYTCALRIQVDGKHYNVKIRSLQANAFL